MSAHNNNTNDNNIINNTNNSPGRELPTSDHPSILFPRPLTTDELGSGLAFAPMTSTVEMTTVVTRENEFVPLGAESYYEQEVVTESKSTSSVHDENWEDSENQELRECNGESAPRASRHRSSMEC